MSCIVAGLIKIKGYTSKSGGAEIFFPHLNLVFQATFSKAGAELGTAQPQLVTFFVHSELQEKDSIEYFPFIPIHREVPAIGSDVLCRTIVKLCQRVLIKHLRNSDKLRLNIVP